LILVATLATAASGCGHFLDYVLFSPYITTEKLPNGTVGVAYDGKVNANSDLGADWYITGGQLPPGLLFRDSHISGTPTVGGTFKFEVTVSTHTTEVPDSDSKTYTVLILDVTTQTLPDGFANESYGPFPLESIGYVGIPSWSIISGNLPAGLSLTSAGVLAGTPTSAGTFSFSVKVTDQGVPARSKIRDLSLNVLNPAPMSASLSPNSVASGDPSFQLVVSGSHFVRTSAVTWNGEDRPTTYVTSTQLVAAIPASDLLTSGMASIAVRNPAPQGGLSNRLAFDVGPASSSSFVAERVSVDTLGNQANGPSGRPSVSANARYVAFESSATNLVDFDQNAASDIFVRDTCRNAGSACKPSTIRVSMASDNSEANGASYWPAISGDGRYVAFVSAASNLVPEDNNSVKDIFLRDTCIGANKDCMPSTFRVSVGTFSSESNGASDSPLLSATARYVAFSSQASNLVDGDFNQVEDIFLFDSCLRASGPCSPSTIRISLNDQGSEFQEPSTAPTFSSDGRFVTFIVEVSQVIQAYLRDTCLSVSQACVPTTQLILAERGAYSPSVRPAISANGRFLTLVSAEASSSNTKPDRTGKIMVQDTCHGAETPLCVATNIPVADTSQDSGRDDLKQGAIVSNSGRYVAFISRASNLVPDDRNQFIDVFVSDTCFALAACIPATWRISRGKGGLEADADSTDLAISPDGKVIAFATAATTLDPRDTNGVSDVFVYVPLEEK